MSDTVLRLAGVERVYATGEKTLHVLRGVDLEIRSGEIVGLVGPSGSGKSSLLHAAGLLERPDGGVVEVSGLDGAALDDASRSQIRLRRLGFVYQFHHLLPEFTALENVALPLRIAGESVRDADRRARSLLERLGLGDRLDHRPAQMSGGEQQRVAIGRALANRPRILLADEPTGNLDPETSASVFDALRDIVRLESAAAVIATHNLALAARMDRVFALEGGRLRPTSTAV